MPIDAGGQLVEVAVAVDGDTQVYGLFGTAVKEGTLSVLFQIEEKLTILVADAHAHELLARAEQTGVVAVAEGRGVDSDGGLALVAYGLLRQHVTAGFQTVGGQGVEGQPALPLTEAPG